MSSKDSLNAGQGLCQPTARLLVKPVRAVIELGASRDVLIATLNAVHHANRHAERADFVAVALPCMKMGRVCMLPGHEIELIGSEAALSRLQSLEGIRTLRHRGMLVDQEVGESLAEPGMLGAAYVRDRGCEKRTAGWVRRNEARAKRRGVTFKAPEKPKSHDPSALALPYGSAMLHIRQILGEIIEGPVGVSTYGFSMPSAPAILPVFPEAGKDAGHAA